MNEHKMWIETIGPKAFRRYRIMGRDRGSFTGEGWDADCVKSLLFYTFQDAARALAKIQIAENFDKPATVYRATVEVLVIGDEQMEPSVLRDYLAQATKLSLIRPTPNDEVVNVMINWSSLHPLPNNKKRV